MTPTITRLRYLLKPREETGRPDLQVLSVYRDYGVIPKDSRHDNFNKTPVDLNRYQVVRKGDVVVNKMKAWQGSIAVSKHEGIVSPDYLVCSVSPEINSQYLHYLLRSLPLVSEFRIRSKGIRPAQWRLYWEDLADIPVSLPPADTQPPIADFLDIETAKLSGLRTARRAQIEVLTERSYAGLSETLIPGALTSPAGARPWPWLPITPEEQPLVRLGYVCELQSGLTVDENRTLSADSITRPYLRVANVQADGLILDTVSEITVSKSMAARSTLRAGDVLMTEGGDLDKLGRGTVWRNQLSECLHQNHIFALRPRADRLDPDYLALMTQTLHGRCYFESTGIRTTNLASTNSSKILGFPVPLPAVTKQHELVRIARRNLDAINRATNAVREQLRILDEHKHALITAAVTGQIDVTTARRVEVS